MREQEINDIENVKIKKGNSITDARGGKNGHELIMASG